MFGTQIDDPVTMTTPPKADPVVTGAKIHGLQIDPSLLSWYQYVVSLCPGTRTGALSKGVMERHSQSHYCSYLTR